MEKKYIFLDTETTVEKQMIFNDIVFVQFLVLGQKEFLKFVQNNKIKNLKDFLSKVTIWRVADCGKKEKDFLKELLLNKNNHIIFFNALFDITHLLKWLYPDEFYL
uniref:Uncharacterized protein n=1 Tax=Caulerpa verticillata TaxID=177082 RepID=A0A386B0D1_9CHLO|nr:hypothetical protein [Caulerpa verticillata]AYC65150.1 hypothetical protein [Caulerpa verticillata]